MFPIWQFNEEEMKAYQHDQFSAALKGFLGPLTTNQERAIRSAHDRLYGPVCEFCRERADRVVLAKLHQAFESKTVADVE